MAHTPSSPAAGHESKASDQKIVRIDHATQTVEGWTVHVDKSLLDGAHKEVGDLALRVLSQRLDQIIMRLPAEPVAEMKKVPIYLDRDHPIGGAHFHPSGQWLEANGYDPKMEKAIHLTSAASLIREAKSPGAGSVVLHELAHAYHNRVLGFEEERILAGYEVFCDSEKFDMVAHTSGRLRPHYGLTDHKEFFAEMTETFFTGNDFYPFHHIELIQESPETYTLIAQIWGAKAKSVKVKPAGDLGVQDLRILATLKSQRGDYEEALEILGKAEAQSPGNGRLASVREMIESAKAKAEKP